MAIGWLLLHHNEMALEITWLPGWSVERTASVDMNHILTVCVCQCMCMCGTWVISTAAAIRAQFLCVSLHSNT